MLPGRRVVVDGVAQTINNTYSFNNVNANHTISVTFAPISYTIIASAGANGAVSPAGVTNVNCGGNQTYTITPDPCYHIADVQVNGSSVGAMSSYTFSNVTANQTISATFAANSYTITASSDANGTITPSGVTTVTCSGSQEYDITANSCYHIADVKVDNVSVGVVSSYTFTNVTSESYHQCDFCCKHLYDFLKYRW